ncbi:MAG: SpoIID/LytB domain-containing protein [Actinomycetota bacterium]
MMRHLARAVVLFPVVAALLIPAAAGASMVDGDIEVIRLEPAPGTTFEIDGKTYGGDIALRWSRSGLALIEEVDVADYVLGIREVPYSWPAEALAAQAVAARTYLARYVRGGRSGDRATYGFDICATSACQVYRGIGSIDESGGDRWVDAAEQTAGEILVFDGVPIEAVYSSSMGSRTRANQDIWGGTPIPYLQPVDSPEGGASALASWTVAVYPRTFVEILKADGHDIGGDLLAIATDDPGEGNGRTTIRVTTEEGSAEILATRLKGVMNRHGPDLAPGLLPARRANGKRLPEVLPSYTYDIAIQETEPIDERLLDRLPPDDRPAPAMVRIDGEGWGHGVGMSQWGAYAMARAGADHEEILMHYYTGAEVVDAGEMLPDRVVVGLDWELSDASVTADGPFTMYVNDVRVGDGGAGPWTIRSRSRSIGVIPPVGQLVPGQIHVRHWPR